MSGTPIDKSPNPHPDGTLQIPESAPDSGHAAPPKVAVALFDNPDTMAREAYQDGRLLCHLTADAMSRKGFCGFPGMPFMLNDGPWSPGKFWGDEAALSDSARLSLARVRAAPNTVEGGSHD